MQSFYSNGKLLITGEYLVLDGALALAIPTQYGQSLEVEKLEKNVIKWESIDHLGKVWFSHRFERHNGKIKSVIEDPVSERLIQIFKAINNLNPKVLKRSHGFKFQTKTNFPNNWGLGSSSTLINNLAVWANIDPYKLLRKTFGGSGYDIACAQHNSPITYQLRDNRLVKKVNFDPEFKDHLFFVHLNKKQNSRDAIKTYRNRLL